MATGYKNKEMTQKMRIPTVRVLFSISPAPRIHDHDWHMILFASRYMCPLNAWNSASLLIAFPYSFASLLLLPCHHLDNTARVPRSLFPDPHHRHGSLVMSFVQDYNASKCDFHITTSVQVAPFLSHGSIHEVHTLTGRSITQPPPLFLRNRNRGTQIARVSSILQRFSAKLVLTPWRIC